MHDIAHFSIYRQLHSRPKRQQTEAMSIYPFFIHLQDFIRVDDIVYGVPDPPDFVLLSGGTTVGVELTELNRRMGGDPRRGEFEKWERETRRKRQPKHVFSWREYTLRQVLGSMNHQLAVKAVKAGAQKKRFDENWLVFNIGDAGGCGACVEANFKPVEKQTKRAFDFAAKFLYEAKLICGKPNPFGQIIFVSGADFVSFRAPSSKFKLPIAKPALLDHGSTVPDAILDRVYSLSSVRRRSGDVVNHRSVTSMTG